MEYKTYIQRPPTVEAYYDKTAKKYHVRTDHGESYVPKDLFEKSWRELTTEEQYKMQDTGYINELS